MHSTRQTTGHSRRLSTTQPEGTAPPQYKRGHVPMPAPTHIDKDSDDTAEPEPSTRRLIRGHVTMIVDDAENNDTTEAGLLRAPSEVTYPDLSGSEAQHSDADAGPAEPPTPMRRSTGDSTADLLRHIADVAKDQAQATIGGRMADKQKRESSKTAFQWAMSELLSLVHSNDPSVIALDREESHLQYQLLYGTGEMRRDGDQPYEAKDMKDETQLWRTLHSNVSAWRKKRKAEMRNVAEDEPTGAPADRSRSGNFADTRGFTTPEGTYPSQDHHSHDRVLRPGKTITTQHGGVPYRFTGAERG